MAAPEEEVVLAEEVGGGSSVAVRERQSIRVLRLLVCQELVCE